MGFVLGLTLSLTLAQGWRAGPLWLACGAASLCVLPTLPLPPAVAGPASALGPALLGAGVAPLLGGGLAGAARLTLGAAAGLGVGAVLDPPSVGGWAWLGWLAIAAGCGVGGVLLSPRVRSFPGRGPQAPSWLAAALGARALVSVAAGALVLSFLGPRDFVPAGAALGCGLGAGLALVAWVPALRRRRLWWGTEPTGWSLVALLLLSAPTQVPGLTRAILVLGGLCAGLGLGRPLSRGGALGLLASPLGLVFAPALFAWAASAWPVDEATGAALGLGSEPEARAELSESLDRGEVVLRATRVGPPTLQVVDVLEQRLLSRDGSPWLGIPTRRGGDWGYATPDLLLAAVPLLLAETPLDRLEVGAVGLGTGVPAGLCLRAGVARVTAIDGDPAAWALLRDPGELFGLANGRLLAPDAGWGERLRLVEGSTWPALRSEGPFDVIALGQPDPDPGLLRLAAQRADLVTARLAPRSGAGLDLRGGPPASLKASVRAFLDVFPAALALWAGDEPGALVLLGGAGSLDLARAQARWPGVGPAVVDARGPFVSWARTLGTVVADAEGLRRFAAGEGPDDVGALLAAGADPPPRTVLPDDPSAASRLLVALAEGAAVRKLPAARAWAGRAAELDRSTHTVRLLGDLVYREGDADAAVALWREALELDPSALGPRLSLVSLYLNRSERGEALRVLEEGLAQAPDAPALHYALGELAAWEDEHVLAARHFQRAGDFRDAPVRVRRALAQVRDVDRTLDLGQQVRAAALLLDRSRATNDADEAQRLRQESLELALTASNGTREQEPGAEVRAALARVLGQLAEGEGFALARENLYAHQARVLAPLRGHPQQIARARALTAAGQPKSALRILSEVLSADPSDAAALLARGDALLALDEREAAIDAYEAALARKSPASSDAWVHESLARLHLEASRPEQGLKALNAALELAPDHPRLLRELAQLLLALERRGDALTALRAYLRVALPDDPDRRQIEQQVEALERDLR